MKRQEEEVKWATESMIIIQMASVNKTCFETSFDIFESVFIILELIEEIIE